MKLYDRKLLMGLKPEDIDIKEIAHNLSQICRYAGATPGFYSVAEHSVIVAEMMYDNVNLIENNSNVLAAMYGLLHDAHEAYIGDIIYPVKYIIKSEMLNTLINNIDIAILIKESLYLDFYIFSWLVEKFDKQLGSIECNKFFNTNQWKSSVTPEYREILLKKIAMLQPRDAEQQFLSMYNALKTIRS